MHDAVNATTNTAAAANISTISAVANNVLSALVAAVIGIACFYYYSCLSPFTQRNHLILASRRCAEEVRFCSEVLQFLWSFTIFTPEELKRIATTRSGAVSTTSCYYLRIHVLLSLQCSETQGTNFHRSCRCAKSLPCQPSRSG